MSFVLTYAGSVIAAFFGWFACGPVGNTAARGVARASLVAVLCAPGILIGHGFGVAPTVFALAVQPSVFTFGSIGIVWLIALGLVFGVRPLRLQRNGWPPSVRELLVDGYVGKFLLFGLVTTLVLVATLQAADSMPIRALEYTLLLGGAAVNFGLCFLAARLRNPQPFLVPILFSAPVLFGAVFVVGLLWYAGGAAGALAARGRGSVAGIVSSVACGLLALNFLERSVRAVDAPSHVTIEGGVAGNAGFALFFVVLAAVSWWWLRRYRGPTVGEGG